ncbi:MAG: nitrogen regulation protein NR(I) [Oceanococcaceae bacterium]
MSLNIWVVDDDDSIRWVLERALRGAGLNVEAFSGAVEMLDALDDARPDVVMTDIRMKGIDGLELLSRLHARDPALPVIVMTAHSDLDAAVAAYKGGAFEYLPKPFDVDEAVDLVQRAAQSVQRTAPAEDGLPATAHIVGEAPAMQEVFRAIGRLAKSQITVLITGESGTGKELVARALHAHSPRAQKPFIAINTAAIPKDLMESEFFGHERGSFTGATAQRAGRFEQADGGTLFLDEIGEMPPDLQTRLLRVLADGQFYRVGGHVPVKVDVRIVAATNQNLEQAVREGRFREDLFHRLNVIRVRTPSLRERKEDIPLLLRHFLNRTAAELEAEVKQLRPDTLQCLAQHDWPGNVRQLENFCRWITVMAPGQQVHLEDLPDELLAAPEAVSVDPAPLATAARQAASTPPGLRRDAVATPGSDELWEQSLLQWAASKWQRGDSDLIPAATERVEQALARFALDQCKGHRQEAARRLGWGRNTLTRKLKEFGWN